MRKRSLAFILLLGILLLLPNLVLASGQDWSTVNGDPGRTYYSSINLTTNLAMKLNPIVKGRGYDQMVISNDQMYAVEFNEKLYAIDLAINKVKWEFGPELRAGEGNKEINNLVAFDGVVYILTNDNLYALEDLGDSYKIKWAKPVGGRHLTYDGKNLIYFKQSYNSIVAVDAITGLEKWEYPFDQDTNLTGKLAAGNGSLFFIANGYGYKKVLMAFDAESGQTKWAVEIGSTNGNYSEAPVYKDGTVFVNASGTIKAFASADGRDLWSYYTGTGNLSKFSVNNESVFIEVNNTVVALDRLTGVEIWKVNNANSYNKLYNPLLVTEDKVFVTDIPYIKIYDAKTGVLLRDFRPPNQPNKLNSQYWPVAIASGMLFITDGDYLYALESEPSGSEVIAAPTGLTATGTTKSQIYLKWTAVSGATSYKLYRAISETGIYSYIGTATTNSYRSNWLSPNTTYWYKISAVKSTEEGVQSNAISGKTLAASTIAVPKGLTAKGTTKSQIYLKWTAVTGATSYKIYRAASPTGTYTYIDTTIKNSYRSNWLSPNKTYWYKISAVNSTGEGTQSNAISGKTLAVSTIAAPTGLTATGTTKNQIYLKWTAVSGATSYKIYRATSPTGTYTYIDTASTNSYRSNWLSPNKNYWYKITAVDSKGEGVQSGAVSGKTLAALANPAPTGLTATGTTKSQIYLTWTPVSGATAYKIYRATSPTGTYTYIDTASANSYSSRWLSANKTYWYKISAVNSSGEGVQSSAISGKTLP